MIEWDVVPVFQNHLLTKIQTEDLPGLCNKVLERGVPPPKFRYGMPRKSAIRTWSKFHIVAFAENMRPHRAC